MKWFHNVFARQLVRRSGQGNDGCLREEASQDAQLGVNFKTSKQVSMQLNYHYFATAAKLDDVKKGLGSEIDYLLDWNVMKDVKLSAGYSIMRGTKSMDVVKGGDHKRWQDWGWVSVNINPRILFVKC